MNEKNYKKSKGKILLPYYLFIVGMELKDIYIYDIIMVAGPLSIFIFKLGVYIVSARIKNVKEHSLNALKDLKNMLNLNLPIMGILHIKLFWEHIDTFSKFWISPALLEAVYFLILPPLFNIFLDTSERVSKDKRFISIGKLPVIGNLITMILDRLIGPAPSKPKDSSLDEPKSLDIDIQNNTIKKNLIIVKTKKIQASRSKKPIDIKEVNNTLDVDDIDKCSNCELKECEFCDNIKTRDLTINEKEDYDD